MTTVTVLATAHIQGDLALLPRLATLLQRERQAAEGLVVLLDLGDTCAMESWTCRATLGRAPLVVLDAMGYAAALVGGPEKVPIPPDALRRLRENAGMATPIWGRPAQIIRKGITLHLVTGDVVPPDNEPAIRVDRTSEILPETGAANLVLGDVPHGVLLRVEMAWPDWSVRAAQHIPVAADSLPDPTITAVVELVESEARHFAQQQGGN